ncbi:hypothetical protein [Desulfolucanica intricata]|uniref:hypothetical protein n=1 Tax=Desulfolucanica intricata TaxID=1285191 RepID=UPI0008374A45|nr:hypothetical protein [Desulfolucanica intricata]
MRNKEERFFPKIIEDDAPLPGPWNRPAPREVKNENEVPVSEDAPLPGPWNRPAPGEVKREREVPVNEDITLPVPWSSPEPDKVSKEKETAVEDITLRLKEEINAAPKEPECPTARPVKKQRCRTTLPAPALFNRQSLIAGIIMSEILGPPGGYRRNRLIGKTGKR